MTKIKDGLYVDDVSTGASEEEEAKEMFCNAKLIFQNAGMNLRKWRSNNQEGNKFIQEKIGEDVNNSCDEDESHASIMLGAESGKQKVLGITWCTEDDAFEVEYNICNDEKVITKRDLLSKIATI